jgi:hypothetical protein
VASAGIILAGCAPQTGDVYERKYYPPHTWTDSVCAGYDGKTGMCTVRIPVVHNNPAQWLLCLDNGEDRGCRYVDETTYHQYPPGSHFSG